MKKLNIKKAVERYNGIMGDIGYEYSQIGTRFSENTDLWNLRDMVAECDYILSTYYECGHCNEDMRHGDEYEKKMWRSGTGKLKRFIKAYEPFIGDIECFQGHCSKYDN